MRIIRSIGVWVLCSMCQGSGTVPVDHRDPRKGDRRCPNCGGTGQQAE